jgi:hypothetical protein
MVRPTLHYSCTLYTIAEVTTVSCQHCSGVIVWPRLVLSVLVSLALSSSGCPLNLLVINLILLPRIRLNGMYASLRQ